MALSTRCILNHSVARYRRGGYSLGALPIAALLLAAPAVATAGVMVEYKNVPVIVNLYQGSGVTPAQVKEALKVTNKVYKEANIKFTLVKTIPNVVNPGDGNSSWTRAERDQGRADGRKEVNDFAFFNNEGIKISYVGQPDAGNTNTNGLSVKRHPVTIVKGGGRPTAQIAETTSHEIGHVLGLEDIYDEMETDRQMFGYRSTRTDTKFTDAEKMTLMHEARIRGIVQKKMVGATPSTSVSTTRGSGIADPAVGATPGPETLVAVSLTNTADPDVLNVRLDLGGTIPTDVPFNATFFIGLDTDNNPLTGPDIGPASGADRHLFINITGPGDGTLAINGGDPDLLFDGAFSPIPGGSGLPTFTDDLEFFNDGDLLFPDVPVFPNSRTTVDIPIELVALSLTSVDPIPVTASSGNPFAPDSTFTLPLTPNSELLGPQLGSSFGEFEPFPFLPLVGDPATSSLLAVGPMIDVTGSQFDPLDMIDLLLDDELLATVQADALGDISEMVALPLGLPLNDFFFITGQSQSTGDFAFFVVESTPEPTVLALVTLGLPAVIRRRHARTRSRA